MSRHLHVSFIFDANGIKDKDNAACIYSTIEDGEII
jgi:hypothetical protein